MAKIKFTGGRVRFTGKSSLNSSGNQQQGPGEPSYSLTASDNADGSAQIVVSISNAPDGTYYIWDATNSASVDTVTVTSGSGSYNNSYNGDGSTTFELRDADNGGGILLSGDTVNITNIPSASYNITQSVEAAYPGSFKYDISVAYGVANATLYLYDSVTQQDLDNFQLDSSGNYSASNVVVNCDVGSYMLELRDGPNGTGTVLSYLNLSVNGINFTVVDNDDEQSLRIQLDQLAYTGDSMLVLIDGNAVNNGNPITFGDYSAQNYAYIANGLTVNQSHSVVIKLNSSQSVVYSGAVSVDYLLLNLSHVDLGNERDVDITHTLSNGFYGETNNSFTYKISLTGSWTGPISFTSDTEFTRKLTIPVPQTGNNQTIYFRDVNSIERGGVTVNISNITYTWTLTDANNESDVNVSTNAPDGTYYYFNTDGTNLGSVVITSGSGTFGVGSAPTSGTRIFKVQRADNSYYEVGTANYSTSLTQYTFVFTDDPGPYASPGGNVSVTSNDAPNGTYSVFLASGGSSIATFNMSNGDGGHIDLYVVVGASPQNNIGYIIKDSSSNTRDTLTFSY